MIGDRAVYATEEEIEQLRGEIRQLKEEGDKQKSSEKPPDQESTKGSTEDSKKGESKQEGESKPESEAKNDGSESEDKKQKESKPHPLRNALLIAGGIVVLIAGVIWWMHSQHFESTDDAQIDGHISGIAARISGTVTGVYVEENQFVKAGQLLAQLDPNDLQVQLSLAASQLSEAQAQARAEQPQIPVTEVTNETNIAAAGSDLAGAEAGVAGAERDYQSQLAEVREAEANAAKARMDVERYRPLAEKNEIPQQQFDQAVATAKALEATVAANMATAEAAAKQVDQKKAQLAQAQARLAETKRNAPYQVAIREANVASRQSNVQAAAAQCDQALLNLSYTRIYAPVDGMVAKRTAEVGQHLNQQLFLVTRLDDLWVTANFHETQIRRMRSGQSVRVYIDALNQDFDGYIESMPAGSGSITSLLPPENATGNYVKVVQRLPMRIRLKKGQPGLDRLRPGMSAEPKVDLD